MITSANGNQYLRPDYLSPLPTTLDAKKSPLALLAQTCSQIGADTGAGKTGLSSSSCSSSSGGGEKASKKDSTREKGSPSSSSSSCSPPGGAKSGFKPYESCEPEKPQHAHARSKTPAKKSGSRSVSPRSSPVKDSGSPGKVRDRDRDSGSGASGPSPGLGAASYLYPELLGLRSGAAPFLGGPYPPHPHPPTSRGGAKECRDPYCTGCHLLGKSCPAGCGQCEKAGHAAAAAYAHAQLAALAAAASAAPYLCSWVGADASYCGKRFSTSEELLDHLRSHTSDSLLGGPSGGHPHPLPLLGRAYTPPRYHPYSKPPLLAPSFAPPFPLPPHPGLPAYLSPYSLYGPRLGASHP